MGQEVKSVGTKVDTLSLNVETYIVKGQNQFLQVPLQPPQLIHISSTLNFQKSTV